MLLSVLLLVYKSRRTGTDASVNVEKGVVIISTDMVFGMGYYGDTIRDFSTDLMLFLIMKSEWCKFNH